MAFKHTLLLVDDEESITKALKRLFRKTDCDVLSASSGKEGLEILKNHNGLVSLIISDQRMPEMNGSEFLEKSKDIVPDAVRFLLTGYSDLDAVIEAVNQGEIHRYLTKPWNDEDLLLQVRQALEQVDLLRENKRLTRVTEQQNEKLAEMNTLLERKVYERTIDLIRKHEDLKEANQKIEKGFMDTIRLLSSLVDTLNPVLGKYMRSTARLSLKIADRLELGEEEKNQIEIAALFHDIGLLGMPSMMIDKPEQKIKNEDFNLFVQHPVFAAIAFETNENLAGAAEIILHHHEHVNGKGFPNGLSGETIPLGARIIAPTSVFCKIVDTWPEEQQAIALRATDYLGRNEAGNLEINEPQRMLESIAIKVLMNDIQRIYDSKIVLIILEICKEAQHKKLGGNIFEFDVSELKTGMVLMQDMRIKGGKLMIARDAVLTDSAVYTIAKLVENKLLQGRIKVLIKET